MNMNDYQKHALATDLGQQADDKSPMSPAFLSTLLGLSGEAGEFTDKMKKVYRDDGGVIPDSKKEMLSKELGDVLWYVAVMADYMGVTLEDLAKQNVSKLADRKDRSVLDGSGDDR